MGNPNPRDRHIYNTTSTPEVQRRVQKRCWEDCESQRTRKSAMNTSWKRQGSSTHDTAMGWLPKQNLNDDINRHADTEGDLMGAQARHSTIDN